MLLPCQHFSMTQFLPSDYEQGSCNVCLVCNVFVVSFSRVLHSVKPRHSLYLVPAATDVTKPTCHNEPTPGEVFVSTQGGGKGGKTNTSVSPGIDSVNGPEDPQQQSPPESLSSRCVLGAMLVPGDVCSPRHHCSPGAMPMDSYSAWLRLLANLIGYLVSP